MTERSLLEVGRAMEELYIERRADIILRHLGLTWEKLIGKKILDVGAYLGEFSIAAAKRHINVVNLDKHRDYFVLQDIARMVRDEWLAITENPIETASIRDIGLFEEIIERVEEKHALTLDIDADPLVGYMRAMARNKITYILGDAHAMPFDPNEFDMVISHAAPPITWCFTKETVHTAMSEAIRVLKIGGEYRFGPSPIDSTVDGVLGRKDSTSWWQERALEILRDIYPALEEREGTYSDGQSFYYVKKS